MKQNCTFLGLGVMGYPMAGHLSAAGHAVTVWNRTELRARKWAGDYAGKFVKTIPQAIENADTIFLCVGDDPDVLAVVGAALEAMEGDKKSRLIVDHTTASPSCARQCYALAQQAGHQFIDAPISGGQAGAQNGELTIMCGGDRPAFERAQPIMQAYAKAITYMGPSGSGQMTKMVNQICIAGLVQGLSEGLNFARMAGLDIGTVTQAIGQGAAQSWQMDNRAGAMAEQQFDFGFAVDWMRKDLRIAMETAKDIGADIPVTAQVDAFYKEVQAMGGGRWDTCSLIKRLIGPSS